MRRAHHPEDKNHGLRRLTRRDVLGFAAKGAAGVVVTQSLLSCDASATEVEAQENGGSASTSCVLTAALTEGPYFVDERLERSDIRSDPATGAISEGVPLELTYNMQRVSSNSCTPLTGAYLDMWHCDASGDYSDVGGATGRRFLRGYQITDANGAARFTTVYPGWYSGRAVHIHFKLRLIAGATTTYEFTSQFFFPESLTDVVHGMSPYSARGRRNTLNSTDGIYNSLPAAEKSALTLETTQTSTGYAGVINLGVQVG